MARRITVVTSGHLSTCPRMLKAADAMSDAGHDVRVVATCHEPWAVAADDDVRSRRQWPVTTVNYLREGSGSVYWRSGIRHRAARAAAGAMGAARLPVTVAANAFGRVHEELVCAIAAQPADFVYGGTVGALAAVADAASRLRVPFGLDLEDFHSEEDAGPEAGLRRSLAARVEGAVLPRAAFLTASSAGIAAAYRQTYGLEPAVIHNTFPLPPRAPDVRRCEPGTLRVYWFSQTIGPGRGLEEAVRALGRAGVAARLTLRGRPRPGYIQALVRLAEECAVRVAIVHEPPAPPDDMVDLARGHDVGLASEMPTSRSRAACLPNKAFTYILAGLAVAMTDTPGQHALGADLAEGAALSAPGDIDALAGNLARWARDETALASARKAAWQAAVRRWHWEHELDRGRLQQLVAGAAS